MTPVEEAQERIGRWARACQKLGLSMTITPSGGGPNLCLGGAWYWRPGQDEPAIETAVRSAVAKVAPGCIAEPQRRWVAGGTYRMTGRIAIAVRDATGPILEHEDYAPEADTYVEAWLNAALAIVEAGEKK